MSPRRRPRPHPTSCRCRGNGWVCEDHPTQPFAFERLASCWCEAPGMPCTGMPAPRPEAVVVTALPAPIDQVDGNTDDPSGAAA